METNKITFNQAPTSSRTAQDIKRRRLAVQEQKRIIDRRKQNLQQKLVESSAKSALWEISSLERRLSKVHRVTKLAVAKKGVGETRGSTGALPSEAGDIRDPA